MLSSKSSCWSLFHSGDWCDIWCRSGSPARRPTGHGKQTKTSSGPSKGMEWATGARCRTRIQGWPTGAVTRRDGSVYTSRSVCQRSLCSLRVPMDRYWARRSRTCQGRGLLTAGECVISSSSETRQHSGGLVILVNIIICNRYLLLPAKTRVGQGPAVFVSEGQMPLYHIRTEDVCTRALPNT
jgi:hypothetical protein